MEKRYDFQKWEPQLQKFWEKEGVYRFDPNGKKPVYSIDTPPPTVSGNLHIGHLFSYAQAEMIARFHRMKGESVYYPMGFDDNGLPTERLVERELGKRAGEIPRKDFLRLCRETSLAYEEQFKALFRSMGSSADWSLSYRTSSREMQALSQRLFLALAKKGLAYQKESPVLWCTECGTSIAQAELDTKELNSAFTTIPFQCGAEIIPVATTRPELLYGCAALFVHPEDPRYKAFLGKTAQVPHYGFAVPILANEEAQPDKGTGAVMCATFGDPSDARWVEKYRLPTKPLLSPQGTFLPHVPDLSGLTVKAGRRAMVQLLKEKGLLLEETPLTHAVSVHERCGTPVELIPSRQWYISLLPQKQALLEAAQRISWNPPQRKRQYVDWVENLKWDWCVSRQRYYGVPLPVWYCKACGKPFFPEKSHLPVDPALTPCPGVCSCGSREFTPETAVLDTWATSSITPLLHRERGVPYPMSMRTHAHEIVRTWTFYSVARSLYHTGELPWKELMITGFVLAKKGEKISKSKGNGPDPASLIREHSADALRLWAANARLGSDAFFSPEDLNPEKRLLVKLWNAGRFAEPLLGEDRPLPPNHLPAVDRWLLARAKEAAGMVDSLFSQYEVGMARHEMDRFFWSDFCDTYIELAKDRLYGKGPGREAARYALYKGLFTVLRLYAPLIPHITEALYREIFQSREKVPSLHLTSWPSSGSPDKKLLRFGESLKQNLSAMRKEKTDKGLSLRADMDCFSLYTDPALFPLFQESEGDLLACAKAKCIALYAG